MPGDEPEYKTLRYGQIMYVDAHQPQDDHVDWRPASRLPVGADPDGVPAAEGAAAAAETRSGRAQQTAEPEPAFGDYTNPVTKKFLFVPKGE